MDYQLLVIRREIIIKQNMGIVLKVGYIIIKQKTGSFLFFYLLREANWGRYNIPAYWVLFIYLDSSFIVEFQ